MILAYQVKQIRRLWAGKTFHIGTVKPLQEIPVFPYSRVCGGF